MDDNVNKLKSIDYNNTSLPISFVETMKVKAGVTCDVYSFKDDDSKDLAIVTVEKGGRTPLQKVLQGVETIEVFYSGKGILRVSTDGVANTYVFPNDVVKEVPVSVGDIMQWQADEEVDLVFYEICTPPYQDGRFKNLNE